MLDHIDDVDWKNLGQHTYGNADQIPQALRDLVSADPQVRAAARGFLLGEYDTFGAICDTTPYILPFVFEVLAGDGSHDKADILELIVGIASTVVDPISGYDNTVHIMRRRLQVYDALHDNLNILLHLLTRGSTAVRLQSVEVIQYLVDDAKYLVPELIKHFDHETDEAVQIALLMSLKALLGTIAITDSNRKDELASFLREVIETHLAPKVRVAAAQASVELVLPFETSYERLSPQVPQILVAALIELTQPPQNTNNSSWMLPLHEVNLLLQDLVVLSADTLIQLLHMPNLSREQAHQIGRCLLAQAFLSAKRNPRYWEQLWDLRRQDHGRFYALEPVRALDTPPRKKIIQAIINANAFWELPTNIFSFFFSLPDSREALQALLD
jgi:hypothetical protein